MSSPGPPAHAIFATLSMLGKFRETHGLKPRPRVLRVTPQEMLAVKPTHTHTRAQKEKKNTKENGVFALRFRVTRIFERGSSIQGVF